MVGTTALRMPREQLEVMMRCGYTFLHLMDSLLSLFGLYSLINFVLPVCCSSSSGVAPPTPLWPTMNAVNSSADYSRHPLCSPSLRQELAIADGALGDDVHSSWDAAIEIECIANFILLIGALLMREATSLSVSAAKGQVNAQTHDVDRFATRTWRLVRLHRLIGMLLFGILLFSWTSHVWRAAQLCSGHLDGGEDWDYCYASYNALSGPHSFVVTFIHCVVLPHLVLKLLPAD
ncbi:putative transmembrane protein [Toxoplasma gondii TgCatPRC2]|uniref:Transmembrane protein n=9 Tax=Toxoplasma gondii TaxID=5811 RepID=S7W1V7_TOXGG|nr:hypothetical protein TGGT1_311840 [Toxoplasma gondii GT1]KAF4639351.1 hypothetical protein TGRH88_051230 [Toxoplasma gondii]KFG44284.1 putative transmembrane protein [Toxoplasma gondii GAB2-2007-GAL-DOM2]KFG55952.1 putative transmembrane protein [Toxoplasma gondii FOU]KFH09537.1 putative transmembrane protein [Toxoplasma gondii VAND]KFH17952.1 putative transmembrane protein [Toxoplasma gondii MAS]KYK69893.1 putative transmembrane protein [Toxoplasma gondii TgCatPRC2]PUA91775.1 putative tr